MTQAKAGDTVRIHYTGTLADGSRFDSSEGRDPLEFVLGSGQVIPGFDKAVTGMTEGEDKTVTIEPADAYGERHDQLVQQIPRSALPDDIAPEIGMQLTGESEDGQQTRFSVTAVDNDSITLDANHPLAGQALTFAISLVSIG